MENRGVLHLSSFFAAMILQVLVLFGLVCCGLGARRNSDGELRVIDACSVKPYEKPCSFVSTDFPQQAPHKLYQVGKFSCFSKASERVALKVSCPTIEITKSSNGKCEFPLELEDESRYDPKLFCGSQRDVTIISKRPDITIRMETGPLGGGRVNCSVECVNVGYDGKEEVTTQLPFLNHVFVEEDSSEHGFGPASKRTTCDCGYANKVSSRIVNGKETKENEYPFIAILVEREDLFPFCGAPIITEWHALTASHCTANPLLEDIPLAIRVGAHNLLDSPKENEVINVAKIVMHGDYQPTRYFKNDIALLVLEKKITFGPHIGRVCLPTAPIPLEDKNVKIIGWGTTRPGGKFASNLLNQINVRVIPLDQCRAKYSKLDIIRPTQMCTYRTDKASCQGDSGGPVVWVDPETNRYTLVGLVSFGKVCGDTNPTVHTLVSYYLDWIQRYIRLSKPSEVCTKA